MLTGTVVNSLGILLGCAVGLLLGKLIPPRLSDAVTKAVALCVLCIGVDGMLAGENMLVTILSMVLGTVVGGLLRLDDRIRALGGAAERRFAKGGETGRFAQGFVSATLLFCVGAMAITGSLDAGLSGDHSTLYAKSMLDAVSAAIYASTMGAGVALSAAAVFVYQGAVTLCASFARPYLTPGVIAEMKCAGSLLIVALSLNMLGLTKLKVMDFLPAVFLPIVLCLFL